MKITIVHSNYPINHGITEENPIKSHETITFLWFSYDCFMFSPLFLWFSYAFPMAFAPARRAAPGPGPFPQEGQAAHRHGQRLAGGYGLQDGHQEERGVPQRHEGDIGYGDGDMR